MLKNELSEYFAACPEVRLAYLFGSRATGRSNVLSDTDVAVLIKPEAFRGVAPYGYKAHVCAELMHRLKTNRVDVVVLNDAGYFLRHRVLSGGKLLFAAEDTERVAFEADTMSKYPDIRRLLSVHWR